MTVRTNMKTELMRASLYSTAAFWTANAVFWLAGLLLGRGSLVPLMGVPAVAIVLASITTPISGEARSKYRSTWVMAGAATVFLWTWVALRVSRAYEGTTMIAVVPGGEFRLAIAATGLCLAFTILACLGQACLRR